MSAPSAAVATQRSPPLHDDGQREQEGEGNEYSSSSIAAFPLNMLSGDTQVMPSQVYRDYLTSDRDVKHPNKSRDTRQGKGKKPTQQQPLSSLSPEVFRRHGNHTAAEVDVDVGDEDELDELAFDDELLSPARDHTGNKAPSAKTNGESTTHNGTAGRSSSSSYGLFATPAPPAPKGPHGRPTTARKSGGNPFRHGSLTKGKGMPMSMSQLFDATQARSSPLPDGLRSDPVFNRPSPNLNLHAHLQGDVSPTVARVARGLSSPGRQMEGLHAVDTQEEQQQAVVLSSDGHAHGVGVGLPSFEITTEGLRSVDVELVKRKAASRAKEPALVHSSQNESDREEDDDDAKAQMHTSGGGRRKRRRTTSNGSPWLKRTTKNIEQQHSLEIMDDPISSSEAVSMESAVEDEEEEEDASYEISASHEDMPLPHNHHPTAIISSQDVPNGSSRLIAIRDSQPHHPEHDHGQTIDAATTPHGRKVLFTTDTDMLDETVGRGQRDLMKSDSHIPATSSISKAPETPLQSDNEEDADGSATSSPLVPRPRDSQLGSADKIRAMHEKMKISRASITPSTRTLQRQVSAGSVTSPVKAAEARRALRQRESPARNGQRTPNGNVSPKRQQRDLDSNKSTVHQDGGRVARAQHKLVSPKKAAVKASLRASTLQLPAKENQNVSRTEVQATKSSGRVELVESADANLAEDVAQLEDEPDVAMARQADFTRPNSLRVFALWKGRQRGFYPATCLGFADFKEETYIVRFDDGNEAQIPANYIRAMHLSKGDTVKVDSEGMRSKTYRIYDFSNDKVAAPNMGSDQPLTDAEGHAFVRLALKKSAKASQPALESPPSDVVNVPVSCLYLSFSMWPDFENRPLPDRMTLLSTSHIAGILNGHLEKKAGDPRLDDPLSASIHGTVTWPADTKTTGIFKDMVFAITFVDDRKERERITHAITAHGGRILDEGFEELFRFYEMERETAAQAQSFKINGAPPSKKSRQHSTPDVLDAHPDPMRAWESRSALRPTAATTTLRFAALIADRHSRRAKYIQALALNLPCLHPLWILDCISAQHPIPCDPYLLPAGESSYLKGAVRSRSIIGLQPTAHEWQRGHLAKLIEQRSQLLRGKNVLFIVEEARKGNKAGPGRNKSRPSNAPAAAVPGSRRAYAFLALALGAAKVQPVCVLERARADLNDEGKESYDLVYVSGGMQEAAETLLGGGKGKDGTVSSGAVKIIDDEYVVQSLILGRLL